MKNYTFIPVFAVMIFSVMFISGCTTGQFVSVDESEEAVQEAITDDSLSGFVITMVLDDNVTVTSSDDIAAGVEETDEEDVQPSAGSGRSSGDSGSEEVTPPTPPSEPQEFTFNVYMDSQENVRSAEFRLTFPAGTEVVGSPVVGEFLKQGGSSVLGPYVSKKGTDILVGMLRNTRTGVSGSGELASVTFMIADPSDIELVYSKVIGENINGTQNILDAQITGNTIYVQ